MKLKGSSAATSHSTKFLAVTLDIAKKRLPMAHAGAKRQFALLLCFSQYLAVMS